MNHISYGSQHLSGTSLMGDSPFSQEVRDRQSIKINVTGLETSGRFLSSETCRLRKKSRWTLTRNCHGVICV